MRFSIIVPVYNVNKYIKNCIESVLTQSFQDYELILINDGTKDDSTEIAKEILNLSSASWKLIDKENGGQGSARNLGVRYATGDYLVFVDSDDYIDSTMLEKINAEVEQSGAEMICFSSTMVDEKKKFLKRYDMCGKLDGIYSIEQYPQMLLFPPAIWNKVVKREFYNRVGCRFLEGVIYEDTVVSRALMLEAKQVAFLDDYLYFYVQRQNSTMGQRKKDNGSPKLLDIITANEALICWFKEKKVFDKYYYEIEHIAINTILFYAVDILNMSNSQDERQNNFVDFIVDNYSGYQNNPYFTETDKGKIGLLMEYRFKDYYKKYGRIKKIKIAVKEVILKAKRFFHS